ncbi:LysR family transcriptional regulator [Pendulispora albinea]|uniref:LysR family transcriptional regulator n=1 Tax=Pendulispora albinea TaxID=2741071 RepID=A0ABZ2LRX9_9BACT
MSIDPTFVNGLGVLAAIVEAGNFVRAAEALGITQSGVSRAVARLEEQLGVRLFHRTSRAVALTEEGARLYEEVAPLLSGIEDAAAQATGAKARVRGRLRVNVDATFGHYVLAPQIGAFVARYPEVSLDYFVRDRMGDLDGEGFDVAVRFGEPLPSSLTCRLLFETRVITCASPEYVAKRGWPEHPRDIAHHECLLYRNPSTGRAFEWVFQRGKKIVPVAVNGRLLVNDAVSLVESCAGGYGVAQLSEFFARDLVAEGRLVQLLPEWADERFPVHAYHRSARLPPAKVRAFLDFVIELVAPSRHFGARKEARTPSRSHA